jgi:hypothetical protein
MGRDVGIRNLLPGVRSVNEIKEDEKAKKDIQNLLEQRTQNTPELNPLDNTLASYIPTTSLDLSSKPIEKTKDTKGFNSQRDYENYLTSRARLKEEAKEARELRSAINTDRIVSQVDKMVKKYDGPSQEKTLNQLNKLKSWAQPEPTGLGNKYRSDTRTPVQKKRDQAKFKYNNTTGTFRNELDQEKEMMDAHRSNEKTNDTKGAKYTPWYERMAQEEAEHLNSIKKQSYEQGGRVGTGPKYVSAQDVINVYKPKQPEATPLQMKQLHQRLQNHNERTGEFRSTVEKPTHKPRFLHNPVTNELEDTYDANWGNDILNDKK